MITIQMAARHGWYIMLLNTPTGFLETEWQELRKLNGVTMEILFSPSLTGNYLQFYHILQSKGIYQLIDHFLFNPIQILDSSKSA